MKALAIVALSLIVIVSTVLFLMLSTCAIGGGTIGGSLNAGERVGYAIAALVTLGCIIAMVQLIRKLNRSIGL
jgi:hypothetical protein